MQYLQLDRPRQGQGKTEIRTHLLIDIKNAENEMSTMESSGHKKVGRQKKSRTKRQKAVDRRSQDPEQWQL